MLLIGGRSNTSISETSIVSFCLYSYFHAQKPKLSRPTLFNITKTVQQILVLYMLWQAPFCRLKPSGTYCLVDY